MKTQYKRGLTYARGTSIDPYLSPDDCETLYQKWDNRWGHPAEFSGGMLDITCEMITALDANEEQDNLALFIKTYGKALSERLREAARTYGG